METGTYAGRGWSPAVRVLRKTPAAGHSVILRARACTGPCTSVCKSINCFFFFFYVLIKSFKLKAFLFIIGCYSFWGIYVCVEICHTWEWDGRMEREGKGLLRQQRKHQCAVPDSGRVGGLMVGAAATSTWNNPGWATSAKYTTCQMSPALFPTCRWAVTEAFP